MHYLTVVYGNIYNFYNLTLTCIEVGEHIVLKSIVYICVLCIYLYIYIILLFMETLFTPNKYMYLFVYYT